MDYPIETENIPYTKHPTTHPRSRPSSPARSRSTSSSGSQNFSRPHNNSLPLRDWVPPVPGPPPARRTIAVPSTPSTPSRTRRPKPKTYFLTGASRGIGLECVRQLSTNPCNTIIAGVRSTTSSSLSTLKALNTNANIHIIQCNVSDPDSLSALSFRVAEILAQKGASLDYIFNIAGINSSPSDTSLTLDANNFQAHMQANVLGPAGIIQSLRRYLARGAVVMNVSSALGSVSLAGGVTGGCAYSMSKAALNMFTVHAARDLKPLEVRIICMEPGWAGPRTGGGKARVDAGVSVEGMLRVVGGLGERDSGCWFRWDGGSVPW